MGVILVGQIDFCYPDDTSVRLIPPLLYTLPKDTRDESSSHRKEYIVYLPRQVTYVIIDGESRAAKSELTEKTHFLQTLPRQPDHVMN